MGETQIRLELLQLEYLQFKGIVRLIAIRLKEVALNCQKSHEFSIYTIS